MLLVISPDPKHGHTRRVCHLAAYDCLIADSLATALEQLRAHPIHALVAIGHEQVTQILAAICQRYPQLDGLLIDPPPLPSTPNESGRAPVRRRQLPPRVSAFSAPVDWSSVHTWISEHELSALRRPDTPEGAIVARGLENLLNLALVTRKNARIDLVTGRKRGRLEVREGVVVHALRDDRCGLAVAREIAGWYEPHATLIPIEKDDAPRTFSLPLTSLIPVSGRRRAELGRLRASSGIRQLLDGLCQIEGCVGAGLFHCVDELAIVTQLSAALHPPEFEAVARMLRETALTQRARVTVAPDPEQSSGPFSDTGANETDRHAKGAWMRRYDGHLISAVPVEETKSSTFVISVAYDASMPVENVHRTAAHAARVSGQVFAGRTTGSHRAVRAASGAAPAAQQRSKTP